MTGHLLIPAAAEKLEICQRDLFSVASLYSLGGQQAENAAQHRWKIYQRTGFIPEWMEKFCLDVLANRIKDIVIEVARVTGEPHEADSG